MSVCLPACLSVCLSIHPFIHPSIYLSVYPPRQEAWTCQALRTGWIPARSAAVRLGRWDPVLSEPGLPACIHNQGAPIHDWKSTNMNETFLCALFYFACTYPSIGVRVHEFLQVTSENISTSKKVHNNKIVIIQCNKFKKGVAWIFAQAYSNWFLPEYCPNFAHILPKFCPN